MRRSGSGVALQEAMKAFWDEKADEDTYFYITGFGAGYQGYSQTNADELFASGRRLVLKQLADVQIEPDGSKVILEIGCGIGRMTKTFAELFAEVYAIDVSPRMVGKAMANLRGHRNVHLRGCDGMDLRAYADRTFDLVYSFGVFVSLPSSELILGYIREAGRVLKPGGTFLFDVYTPLNSRWQDLRMFASTIKWRLHDWGARLFGLRTITDFRSPFFTGKRVRISDLRSTIETCDMKIKQIQDRSAGVLWFACIKRLEEETKREGDTRLPENLREQNAD